MFSRKFSFLFPISNWLNCIYIPNYWNLLFLVNLLWIFFKKDTNIVLDILKNTTIKTTYSVVLFINTMANCSYKISRTWSVESELSLLCLGFNFWFQAFILTVKLNYLILTTNYATYKYRLDIGLTRLSLLTKLRILTYIKLPLVIR